VPGLPGQAAQLPRRQRLGAHFVIALHTLGLRGRQRAEHHCCQRLQRAQGPCRADLRNPSGACK